jgi:hypothetical protein
VKTLLAVILISTASVIGCGKAPVSAAVSTGVPAHGYELAKTWDYPTMKAKAADARSYYNSEAIGIGTLDPRGSLQLRIDANDYELCGRRAQMERLCKLPNNEKTKECAGPDAVVLGPEHIAQCDKLIDGLPKLIEKRDAALKAELSK